MTTAPHDLTAVQEALEAAGIAVDSADTTMLPTSTIELDTAEAASSVLRVIDALDENDDVQDVYANFDIPDAVMEAVEV